MKNIVVKVIIPSLIIFLAMPVYAQAQNWTPEQQEVINHAKKSSEMWFKAVFDQNDYSKWLKEYAVEDYNFWFTGRGVPMDIAGDIERVEFIQKEFKRIYLEEQYPLAVKIYGDIACLYFYQYAILEDPEGKITRKESKRLHVYRKQGDTWKLIEGVAVLTDL